MAEKQDDNGQQYAVSAFPEDSLQRNFVNDLKKVYVTYKKCQGLSIMLTDCFEKSENPFSASLSIALNSFDYSQSKASSLTFTVVEVFTSWIQPRMENYQHLLTKNIKLYAFKVASGQKNKSLSLLIVNTYQLKENNYCYINDIRNMLSTHKYKEACELVKILSLEENFTIYDFLVPLFLQDKLNIIDEFLVDNTAFQIAFITFLDSLVIENNLSARVSNLIGDLNMPDIPINILCKLYNVKSLSRCIKRLLAQFNLPNNTAPNFSKRSEHKTVSYLIHKRFSDKAITNETFRELVVDLVKGNNDVTKEFLLKLAQAGAFSEAAHWCQVLNVPDSEVPVSVKDYCNIMASGNGAGSKEESTEDDWEEVNIDEYHTLLLPASVIVFVSSETQLLSFLDEECFGGCSQSSQTSIAPLGVEGNVPCVDNTAVYNNSTVISNGVSSNLQSPNQSVKANNDASNCKTLLEQDSNRKIPSSNDNEVSLSSEISCEKDVLSKSPARTLTNKSLLVAGGASLISGAASLVSGGASIVSGGVNLMSGTASLVCSGASVVSGGASLVSSGVTLATGRASLVQTGASLISGGASLASGSSSLVTSGVSLISGTASIVSGGVSLVSGSASVVSGAATIVAGGVAKAMSRCETNKSLPNPTQSFLFPKANLRGPNNSFIISLDCEWKPSGNRGKTELSLLQLATPTRIYILDMIALNSWPNHWDQLILNLFNNQDILKIGFSLHTDMMFLSSYFDCDYLSFGCNLLDLADLWSKLTTEYNFQFPYTDESQENSNSLSRLVYLCLGKYLDKKERFSNWELRPLRDTQIQYAALDSFCLIEIYNVIRHLCIERDLPFDDIVNEVVHNYNEKLSKKKKKQEEAAAPEANEIKVLNVDPISVDCVSLICDKMVSGLAKKLRRCGISVDLVDPKSTTKDIIEKALAENKYILVKGHSFKKIKESIPPKQVYKIKAWNPDSQFIEVLNYFNFSVKSDDVFSRCLECNSNCMLKCSKVDVESWHKNPMLEVKVETKGNSVPGGYECDLYNDDGDDFLDYDDDYDDDDYVSSSAPKTVFQPITTKYGCPIKVDVPESVLKRVSIYHLCESCGKIYWNEGQFDQILGTLNSTFYNP